MANEVKLVKKRNDGKYVITKDGVYFTLTLKQFEQVNEIYKEIKGETWWQRLKQKFIN